VTESAVEVSTESDPESAAPPAPAPPAELTEPGPAAREPEPDSVPAPATEPVTPEAARQSPTPQREVGTDPVPPPSADAVRLVRVTWSEADGDTVVRLWLDGEAASDRLEALRLRQGEPRAVLKIDGVDGDVPRQPVAIGSPHVVQLRFGIHSVAGRRQLHVVADLVSAEVELVGPPRHDADGVELRFQ
jgi:hypothetical protein